MASVYLLTLRQLAGRWRLAIIAVVAALPVLITTMTLRGSSTPSVAEFEEIVLSGMLIGAAAPLIVLALAGVAFANEVEDRTLANLTLAPIPRWQIALPKLLAAITVAGPFIAVSGFLTGYVAFIGDLTAALAVAAGSLLGAALYASAFTWLGLVSTQAIGIGLLYIVLWEGFLASMVSGVRLLSIRHYAIAWMHGIDPRRFADVDVAGFGLAIGVSALVFGGFLLLAVRRLRRMDVP